MSPLPSPVRGATSAERQVPVVASTTAWARGRQACPQGQRAAGGRAVNLMHSKEAWTRLIKIHLRKLTLWLSPGLEFVGGRSCEVLKRCEGRLMGSICLGLGVSVLGGLAVRPRRMTKGGTVQRAGSRRRRALGGLCSHPAEQILLPCSSAFERGPLSSLFFLPLLTL